jgi:hypothetical protein
MPQSKKLCFIITWEGLGWVTKTLCIQKEANAFSLWNNNLGYQGILECVIQPLDIKLDTNNFKTIVPRAVRVAQW